MKFRNLEYSTFNVNYRTRLLLSSFKTFLQQHLNKLACGLNMYAKHNTAHKFGPKTLN